MTVLTDYILALVDLLEAEGRSLRASVMAGWLYGSRRNRLL